MALKQQDCSISLDPGPQTPSKGHGFNLQLSTNRIIGLSFKVRGVRFMALNQQDCSTSLDRGPQTLILKPGGPYLWLSTDRIALISLDRGPQTLILKSGGPYLWLSTNRIALFHWTLDLRHLCPKQLLGVASSLAGRQEKEERERRSSAGVASRANVSA